MKKIVLIKKIIDIETKKEVPVGTFLDVSEERAESIIKNGCGVEIPTDELDAMRAENEKLANELKAEKAKNK